MMEKVAFHRLGNWIVNGACVWQMMVLGAIKGRWGGQYVDNGAWADVAHTNQC